MLIDMIHKIINTPVCGTHTLSKLRYNVKHNVRYNVKCSQMDKIVNKSDLFIP